MKKVLNGIHSFHALGLKKQLIAAAICAGLGMSVNITMQQALMLTHLP
jgi:hypothetical protein